MNEEKRRFPFVILKSLNDRLENAKKVLGINKTAIITIAVMAYLDSRGL